MNYCTTCAKKRNLPLAGVRPKGICDLCDQIAPVNRMRSKPLPKDRRTR